MKEIGLPLIVAAMMGLGAIFEKLSLKEASPLAVFTIRSCLICILLLLISFFTGQYRSFGDFSGRTYLWIVIPALMATVFLWLYFSVLQGDLASRVVPLVAVAPVFTLFYSVLFLGEPLSLSRVIGVFLITMGVLLVK